MGNAKKLSDELLLKSYLQAFEYNLDKDFIRMLEKELKRGGLPLVTGTDKTKQPINS